ncbi:neurotrimin-like isoform X2 [Vespula squamosa]|uniref:Neurotrimin-like isoform X2 n=1 Tax=Vespula squamosa TaxID=30214 RepID=A0ABD2BQX5_VESSQ
MQIGILHLRSSVVRNHNKLGSLTDFDICKFISASLKRISTNFDINLPHFQPTTNHPPSISTYLIFNQLHIIHPQFRPKSRTSVLEPSQNFLSNQNRVFLLKRDFQNSFNFLALTIVIECSIVVILKARSKKEATCRRGPYKLWLKKATIRLLSYFRRFEKTSENSF